MTGAVVVAVAVAVLVALVLVRVGRRLARAERVLAAFAAQGAGPDGPEVPATRPETPCPTSGAAALSSVSEPAEVRP